MEVEIERGRETEAERESRKTVRGPSSKKRKTLQLRRH
jgi:hypothetical protein